MTAYASPAELWIIAIMALAVGTLALVAVLTRQDTDR